MLPSWAISQELGAAENDLQLIHNKNEERITYQVITPILLRESSTLHYQNENFSTTDKPFLSLLSSLAIPGTGQLRNKTWWKAGIFMAVEAASAFLYVDYRNRARSGEREFERYSDQNWSVVQYSQWLVNYHEANNLDNPHIDELRSAVDGENPAFNTNQDWNVIDLELLRDVERNTLYINPDAQATNNNFSHTLPDYGSQQYYELISKYYQYQSGWRDYNQFHDSIGHTGNMYNNRFLIDRNGDFASPYFFRGAELADEFNTEFRRSGYFISILIANHVISAFDAYFTVKLKQNRLQATSSIMPGKQLTVSYSF